MSTLSKALDMSNKTPLLSSEGQALKLFLSVNISIVNK